MSLAVTPSSPFLTADDQSVGLFPTPSELTVAQAAEFLGVPEPDLIELLDTGEIESRLIGNRHLVVADSLFDYDRQTTRLQDEALDELTQQNQELGLD